MRRALPIVVFLLAGGILFLLLPRRSGTGQPSELRRLGHVTATEAGERPALQFDANTRALAALAPSHVTGVGLPREDHEPCAVCSEEHVRAKMLGLPGTLARADAYGLCREYNPGAVELTRSEFEGLRLFLADESRVIEELTQTAIFEFHDYVMAKLRNGEFEETDDGLSNHSTDGETTAISPGGPGQPGRIVRVWPGEWAPVDVAYDNVWLEMNQAREHVRGVFAGR